MTEKDAIHTRLDYIEEKFDTKMGELADAIKVQAEATTMLIEKVADQRLLEQRVNQHSAEIQSIVKVQTETAAITDSRLDTLEKKIPISDLTTKIVFSLVGLLITSVAVALYSQVINT